jgi:hypothetical protein
MLDVRMPNSEYNYSSLQSNVKIELSSTPERLRIDRAEFDRNLAERRKSERSDFRAKISDLEFGHLARLAEMARQQAKSPLPTLPRLADIDVGCPQPACERQDSHDLGTTSCSSVPAPNRDVSHSQPYVPHKFSGHLHKTITHIWKLVSMGEWTERQAEIHIDRITNQHYGRKERATKWSYKEWARCGIVPSWINRELADKETAVIAYILYHLKTRGVWNKYNGYIAKAVGCCVKTVQRAIRRLDSLGIEGLVIKRGKFDGLRNEPTKITLSSMGNKLWKWINRNSAAGELKEAGSPLASGHEGPASLITERSFYRPARDEVSQKRTILDCHRQEPKSRPPP